MADNTGRSVTGLLICLDHASPDRRASAARCTDASCGAEEDRVEGLSQWRPNTVYLGRIPRFAYFARRRRERAQRPDSLQDTVTLMKSPVVDQPIEDGVK